MRYDGPQYRVCPPFGYGILYEEFHHAWFSHQGNIPFFGLSIQGIGIRGKEAGRIEGPRPEP